MEIHKRPHSKSKLIVAISTALVLLLLVSTTPFIAMATTNDAWLENENDAKVLHWNIPSNKDDIDGFIIKINGDITYIEGNTTSYFDITELLQDAGEYNIFVYSSINGKEVLIGSCSTITTITLGSVTNIAFSKGILSWNKVKHADKYIVFVNNILVATTNENITNLSSMLALSGEYDIIIFPFSENEHIFSSGASHKTVMVKSSIDMPIDVYVFNYLDSMVLSWQGIDGMTYSYTLSSSSTSTTNTLISTSLTLNNLEDGTYTFSLYGNDGNIDYNFGTTTFSVVNGQVSYE